MFLASKWIPPPPHIVISSRKITQIWGPIPLFWFRIEEDGLMEPPNIFENNDSFKFEKTLLIFYETMTAWKVRQWSGTFGKM